MASCFSFPITDGSFSSAASFIIMEAERQIEKMAYFQCDLQGRMITRVQDIRY